MAPANGMAAPAVARGVEAAAESGRKVCRVLRSFVTKPGCGYLAVGEGQQVEVLHEGEPGSSEDGWIFARLCGEAPREVATDSRSSCGWLPRSHVDAPHLVPCDHDDPLWRSRYAVNGASRGYLAVGAGEPIEVVYRGSAETGDEGWLFVRSLAPPRAQGWLQSDNIEAVGAACQERSAGLPEQKTKAPPAALGLGIQLSRPLGGLDTGALVSKFNASELLGTVEVPGRFCSELLAEGLLRPMPDAHCPEFAEPKLGRSDKVQVLALKGDFAKVQMQSGTKGWIPVELLARLPSLAATPPASRPEPESEPPPPLPAPIAAPEPPCSWLELGLLKKADEVPIAAPEPPCSWLELGLLKKANEALSPLAPLTAAVGHGAGPALGPATFLGRVDLVTFGLENFDEELTERCHEYPGGGATISLDEGEIRAALVRKSVAHDTIIVDARCFPDPEAFLLTRHIGLHHEIIARLYRHRNFRGWLAVVKARFLKARVAVAGDSGRPQRPLTLAVYCRSGKHRSVAAAEILAYVLRSQGWLCPATRHLSQPRWGHYCCRGLCDECQNPPPELEDTLGGALKTWHCLGAVA